MKRTNFIVLLFLFLAIKNTIVFADEAESMLPHTAITSYELAIIINENDPQSVQVGEYYQQARKIPKNNVIRVKFPNTGKEISVADFKKLKLQIEALSPSNIQAYAITWTTPFRVGGMSITSAITFGYDAGYTGGCNQTTASPYFNSPTLFPYTDLRIRPSMMLAGTSFDNVKALIDKAVMSDFTYPTGDAYLVDTGGGAYNVRASGYAEAKALISPAFRTYTVKNGAGISFKNFVMFYFTGTTLLQNLQTLKFLPGALADHLTSYGGDLTEMTGQSKALRWLEAGATASYGTVVEPCNHLQKFPVPLVAMFHYLTGSTAIEAYWKSVMWPGQGVFIGEPLAKPFAPQIKALGNDEYELLLFSPNQRSMVIQKSDSIVGPFTIVGQYPIKSGLNKIIFKLNKEAFGNSVVQLRWQ